MVDGSEVGFGAGLPIEALNKDSVMPVRTRCPMGPGVVPSISTCRELAANTTPFQRNYCT
jgi:hypothetical protein